MDLKAFNLESQTKAYSSPGCRICKAPFGESLVVKEMMFGFRDEFKYQQCSLCGCLQIAELPVNISKYYPPYYYSFTANTAVLKRQSYFKRLFGYFRLKKLFKTNRPVLKYLKPVKIAFSDKILEIGCGKGQQICNLFNIGFENIEGVDKFIPEEIDHGFGVKIMKKDLVELQPNQYDLIIMNHVLEHMDQQQEVLKNCRSLLKEQGCLMIAIPVIAEAFNIYKANWVQLDAPRHFFLHTVKSMSILAQQTGFEIRNTYFDSASFQFWASELYQRDIPLFSIENDYQAYPFEKIFSEEEIETFEMRSRQLNEKEMGDTVVFYLYKSS
ncbi:class I SAM-dependent methyltransferase [Pedobacter rhodius]|uniref:Class I SAM-dependent methyltransferase n=1 Tax=Pedobacter rhodius TaxID=3004098 RepID=A0ABT4KXV7_9SPHI|nr:class I SAM-dependent methyltransferase [Pedobacter sp. SJ11]MCZ4223764.1 class I SAM-dependent methyltransferase [Pedobacter sp. SJ11]